MNDFLTLDPDGRVADHEGKTLDYKRDLSGPEGVLRTVVAFANSAGGRLVIGVADDRSVVGVDDPVTAEMRLANLIADSIRPQLLPTIELITLDGRTVLVANVPVGGQRPYYLKEAGRYGGAYVRLGSSNRRATRLLTDDLARGAGSRTFDRQINPQADIDDIDPLVLERLLGRPIGEEELLTLELVGRENGRLRPTNAGLLVACPSPQRFFPHAWVQCGRFRGRDGLDLVDQADVRGPLPLAVDEVMSFLQRHRFLRAEFGAGDPEWNWRRRDVSSIPEAAIRELVVNALVHSSYSYGGTAIKVVFYDRAIVVESPGGLVPGVTIEQITHGVSVQRNPALARVFREAGLVELWGMGLRTVIRDLTDGGYEPPDIEELHERLRITVRIPDHDPRYFTPVRPRKTAGASGETGARVSNSSEQVSKSDHQVESPSHQVESPSHQVGRLDESALEVLTAVSERDMSRSELLTGLGLTNETRNARRHLDPLLEAGLIERTVPDRPNSRLQRYRITDAGRARLNSPPGPAE